MIGAGRARHFVLVMMIAAVLFLAGCNSLTNENYQKIKMGMGLAEVEAILGKADTCSETMGARSCMWGNDEQYIKVSFLADKATLFSNMNLD